jgi:thiosulfate dehydrogenase [quinone] large subunit
MYRDEPETANRAQLARRQSMPAKLQTERGPVTIADPPLIHKLLSTTSFSWLWLIVRLYVGYKWISAGWEKLSGGTWASGEALKGFWTNAAKLPADSKPPIAYDWYRAFIQYMLDNGWYTWFADVVMWGELLVGVALILGAFVGIAAFFGAFMNWNYIMAGSASTNGLLFTLAILLMMAWKVAGWYGLDRFLLPALGTPWSWPATEAAPAHSTATAPARPIRVTNPLQEGSDQQRR